MPGTFTIVTGDSLELRTRYAPNYFHSLVMDPPYGLGFMGREWDRGVPGVPFWEVALDVARPGAMLAAFSSPRTQHVLASAIEAAGWEIRDSFLWLYGSGMPKGLDVAKAIDKRRDDRPDALRVTAAIAAARDAAGVTNAQIDALFGTHGMAGHWTSVKSQPHVPEWDTWEILKHYFAVQAGTIPPVPEVVALGDLDELVANLNDRKGEFGDAWHARPVTGTVDEWENRSNYALTSRDGLRRDVPHLPEAEAWDGFNTAVKPAYEPIIVARKPLAGTVAENVLEWGCGAYNVDACRIHGADAPERAYSTRRLGAGADNRAAGAWRPNGDGETFNGRAKAGRWPANVIIDEAAAAMVDAASGDAGGHSPVSGLEPSSATAGIYNSRGRVSGVYHADAGGASRFFYTAKADSEERHAGCEGMLWRVDEDGTPHAVTVEEWEATPAKERRRGNPHPTVKPLDLMRWLTRLVTPPGGHVLDMFAGSGSTVAAGVLEGFDAHGIEIQPWAARVAEARALHWQQGGAFVRSHAHEPQRSLFDD